MAEALRSPRWPLPEPRPMLWLLATLALGVAGGALFVWLHMPLAWMLGAMLFTMVPTLTRVPLTLPRELRSVMLIVLGVLIGSAFTPDVLGHLAQWALSIGVMVLFVIGVTALTHVYLVRVAGLDGVTAFFSAAPGGLAAMAVLGHAMGGDEREISLIHSVRIVLTTTLIPISIRIAEHGLGTPTRPPPAALHGPDMLVLLATGLVGWAVARPLRLPAPFLIGPMLASIAVHLAGLSASRPPYALVAFAQVVLGCSVGVRFAGVPLRRIGRAVSISLGSTLALLASVAGVAWGIHLLLGQDMKAAVLAYAPGGVPEMTLMAITLDIDVAFVAVHHLVRVMLIMSAAPLIFRLFPEWIRAAGQERKPEG